MTYIKSIVLYTILLLSGIGVFTWFIDPYGMYWSPKINHLNLKKPEANNRTRVTKPYRVNQLKPQILIMGNSRPEMGLSPYHELFKKQSVYNLSLAGAKFHMQIDHIFHAMHENDELHTILFGLDFFDFLVTESNNKINEDRVNYVHRFAPKSGWKNQQKYYLELLSLIYSLDALKSSFTTIFQQNLLQDNIDELGFNDAISYEKIIKNEGKVPLFKQKFEFIEQKLQRQNWQINSKEGSPISPKFEKLAQLIELTKERDINLKLFINPYHYTYLLEIADQGYFELYLEWKKALAEFITLYPHIRLVDFSGFNEFTLEPENLSNPHQNMRWYWEPAHYKKELGDMMIEALYNIETSDFGIELNHKNANSVVEKEKIELRKARENTSYLITL